MFVQTFFRLLLDSSFKYSKYLTRVSFRLLFNFQDAAFTTFAVQLNYYTTFHQICQGVNVIFFYCPNLSDSLFIIPQIKSNVKSDILFPTHFVNFYI